MSPILKFKTEIKNPEKNGTLGKAASGPKGHATRERMLTRAAELFANRGYEGVGIQEIAKSTGVTKGALFFHFENKRHIYVESVKQVFAIALDIPRHPIKATSPEKRLRKYLEWILTALSDNRVARRLVLRIIIDHDMELMRTLMKEGPLGESYSIFMSILKDLKPCHDKNVFGFFHLRHFFY